MMSIKKGNRRRTRRDYNFVDFTVHGLCMNWVGIKKVVRNLSLPPLDSSYK